jgi:hypothetical protein
MIGWETEALSFRFLGNWKKKTDNENDAGEAHNALSSDTKNKSVKPGCEAQK